MEINRIDLPNEVIEEYDTTFSLMACDGHPSIKHNNDKIERVGIVFKKLLRSEIFFNQIIEIQCALITGLKTSSGLLSTSFRKTNKNFVLKELQWYLSCSLSVDYIAQYAKIWKEISSDDGYVNSNYGWCLFSSENGNQYESAVQHLIKDSNSRHATMIYTRPSIHKDWNKNGMSDFICTNYVQVLYHRKSGKLNYNVHMRSNDFIYGFFNDFFWHCFVARCLMRRLGAFVEINWIADSLHVYPRHFKLFE